MNRLDRKANMGDEGIEGPTKRMRKNSDEGEKQCSDDNNDQSNNESIYTHSNLSDIVCSKVLENAEKIAKSYQSNSKPYPHGFVEDVFVDGFLGKF